ncbi:MAG TPA: type VI secretion system ImpA family N-terminal domain-containing protein [Limnobacter sp.]|nr:type VI secretion system ImpA family N-terminal domain-containing protein [Limnobacter sp.]
MISFPQFQRNVSSSSLAHAATPAPSWAQPFADGTCGPNLEYDNAFLALQQAASGKPESQFEPATPPDWNVVESVSSTLLDQSRDLRLVVLWAESQINLQGFECLPQGLAAILALIESAWPTLNPPLDDGDPYARLNVIESLGHGGSFFQSLRHVMLFKDPRVGELRAKDIEVLFGNVAGAPPAVSRDQLEQFLLANGAWSMRLRQVVEQSQLLLQHIVAALSRHVESDRVPQLTEFKALLRCLLSSLPEPQLEQTQVLEPPSALVDLSVAVPFANPQGTGFVPGVSHIASRAQALAAIDAVCAYLEHAEPTNPAQLLLKRARRLVDKNFMQLMKDLAPDALAEVAKIMGVNPDSLEQDDR